MKIINVNFALHVAEDFNGGIVEMLKEAYEYERQKHTENKPYGSPAQEETDEEWKIRQQTIDMYLKRAAVLDPQIDRFLGSWAIYELKDGEIHFLAETASVAEKTEG